MRAELRLDATTCSLSFGDGAQPDIYFPVSIADLTGHTLQHAPPTPLEVEQAIAVVEDAIMPFAGRVPVGLQVHSTSEAVRRIAQIAPGKPALADLGVGSGVDLDVDAIEALFSRWVRMVHGAPAAREGVPEDAEFAASAILLRECMHHLRWATLRSTA